MEHNSSLIRCSSQNTIVFYLNQNQGNDNQGSLLEDVANIYRFCQEKALTSTEGNFIATHVHDLSQRNITIKTLEGELRTIKKIKISSYNLEGRCRTLEWKFKMIEGSETYITPRSEDNLREWLNGQEYERLFPVATFPIPEPGFWNVWETECPEQVRHYTNVIYPQIQETLQNICKLNPGQELTIMDIGGGSGKLAASILKDSDISVKTITVIDSSSKLIKQAEQEKKKYKGKLFVRQRSIEDICDKLYSTPQYAQSTDVIILCGVVAHQVLNKVIAKNLMEKCHSILKDNGMIIAASLSPSLLTAKEYNAMGYEVLNKTFSFVHIDSRRGPSKNTNDFYILQKK